MHPDFNLIDRKAILTGAASGIGLAVLQAYLAKGAKCFVCDLKETPELKDLSEKYPGQLDFEFCDVTEVSQIRSVVAKCQSKFGQIDILFNNAAIFDMGPLEESGEEMYDRLFAVNVKGMFFFMKEVAENMKANRVKGKIINMSSQAGRRGEALVSHYCAGKAAVISYTQSAAMALAPYKINVNAIAPGVIDTPMWEQVDALFAKYQNLRPGEKKKAVGEAVPLGYMGKPQDIVGVAVFLASSASDYITAQTINVDGGNVMS